MALVLDMVRVDPDAGRAARCNAGTASWPTAGGVHPEHPATNRELLDGALRLSQVLEAAAAGVTRRREAAAERAIG